MVTQATLPSAALLVSDSCEGVAPQREQPPNIASLPHDPFVVRKSAHMQVAYSLGAEENDLFGDTLNNCEQLG